jgi:DNA-binding transcriptional ArsR family regulator
MRTEVGLEYTQGMTVGLFQRSGVLSSDPDIASVGALVGDRSRATMLCALLEGRPLAAGDLARRAGVSLQTASSHLARLAGAGLVLVAPEGRLRYYRLAGPDVVRLLEAMALVASSATPLTPTAEEAARTLRFARTCYDHLAGKLGVAITDALVDKGLLRRRRGTLEGRPALGSWLAALGLPLERPKGSRRPEVRACLDWSERRFHLAGAAGEAVAYLLLEEGWVVRVRGSRAVRVSDRGRAGLLRELGLRLDGDPASPTEPRRGE